MVQISQAVLRPAKPAHGGGYGIWKVPAQNAADPVSNAIKLGYRHIDRAHYNQNSAEAGAGKGGRRTFKDGIVQREELAVHPSPSCGTITTPSLM